MNKYLNRDSEERLISIGNKRYYLTMILTVVWIILTLGSWGAFMMYGDRSFTLISNYIPLILCVFPFFPFSAHKILFSKTFYATVHYTVNDTQFQQLKNAYVKDRPDTVDVLQVKFKNDDGKVFTISYPKKNDIIEGIHYRKGDRVFFVRGLKYPLEVPITDKTERTCPRCGRTVEVNSMVCKRCKFDYSDI